MNERIEKLAEQAGGNPNYKAFRGHFLPPPPDYIDPATVDLEKFAELIVRECIDKIETYRIPVGNSAAGEMACEWTYDALKEIRDKIREHFGVEE
jgi:hypothetical protein